MRPSVIVPAVIIPGLALVLLAGCAAQQAEEPARPAPMTAPGADETEPLAPVSASAQEGVELVVVTGSYIRGSAEDSAPPVDAITNGTLQQVGSIAVPAQSVTASRSPNTERYQHFGESAIQRTNEQPLSTFSIDVDSGAYANVRRHLNAGALPPQDAVRVEEMINYFDYQYVPPTEAGRPFNVATEIGPAPWNTSNWLLKIGIQGKTIAAADRPAVNLVFLVDVSGSMQEPDKLPLLKKAFRLLVEQLTGRDRISMVVYAGRSGVVLEPTPGDQHQPILGALDRLQAGGSTNGGEGIQRAYQLARAAFLPNAVNRVILATDGDFNVGVVNFQALLDIAKRQRATGVALTTLGFGTGNYNDELLEQLADAGDGNYAYVDSLAEARKVLVTELSATLVTIAKDVKIQIEFNPQEVLEYRLIGYQNRRLQREDFNNDAVDAGEIGAGHRVTALYEIVPKGGNASVDPLRYGTAVLRRQPRNELAHLRLRYQQPGGGRSQLLEVPITNQALRTARDTSQDFQFAASVAAFGERLRGGKYLGDFGYQQIGALANASIGADRQGYRREFSLLVKLAESLAPPQPPAQQVGDSNP